MTESEKDTTSDLPPFAAMLRDLNKGATHAELGEQLRALVAGVTETGKPGTLVLRIDVKPQKGDEDMVTLTARVTGKIPQLEPRASIFFVAPGGALTRNPVHQPSMFEGTEV